MGSPRLSSIRTALAYPASSKSRQRVPQQAPGGVVQIHMYTQYHVWFPLRGVDNDMKWELGWVGVII